MSRGRARWNQLPASPAEEGEPQAEQGDGVQPTTDPHRSPPPTGAPFPPRGDLRAHTGPLPPASFSPGARSGDSGGPASLPGTNLSPAGLPAFLPLATPRGRTEDLPPAMASRVKN